MQICSSKINFKAVFIKTAFLSWLRVLLNVNIELTLDS